MISTFDPLSGANGRWVYHQLTSARDITLCTSCLYRGPNVSGTAVDMAFEIDKITQLFHSQKRPADSNSLPGGSPQKRRRILAEPNIPHSKFPRNLDATKSSGNIKAPAEIIELSDSDTQTPIARKTETHRKIHAAKVTNLSDSESDQDSTDEETLALLPSSKHATWPLKYVRPMAEGFSKMSTMSTGTVPDRFTSAFGLEHWKKVTWNTHSNIWDAASDELKDRYIDAGFTKSGLWKNFSKEVRDMYDGGRIPGKRQMKGKGKKKSRDHVAKGNVKREQDVIILTSD